MKLARYSIDGGSALVGVISGQGVYNLARVADAPADMIQAIARWADLADGVRALLEEPADHPLEAVQLLAPIPRPGKILGIGFNYADHAAEAAMELPTEPLWFCKQGTCINDPDGVIQLPKVSGDLDYEAELVLIIGKRIRHASREQAKDAIFGYCCGNDVSVRDWQFKTTQVMIGKSFDTHAPIGPWIVPAGDIDPHTLDIRCFVNDEERQNSNTRHLIFDCYTQIEYLSKVMTLEPGDIIFTGTPSGVAAVMKPPRWLVAGDRVCVEIAGIGRLENTVQPE